MGLTSETTTRRARRWAMRNDPDTGERYMAVALRGAALNGDAILNKGTCFTPEERDEFGLRGVLPAAVSSPAEQEQRSYENFLKAGDDVGKYLFLASLQDRNETLYYKLLTDHLEEMVPIVYTPTVGKVCEHYSHIYRRPRGLYVSTRDRGHIEGVLRNADCHERPVIVVTDNAAILGIGDQGVGGMGIAIGKLALYSAGAGIHPWQTLPLDLDVGTDNTTLLEDPLYLGVRHPRLRGEAYLSLVDELVDAIHRVFPGAIVQWEDFSNRTAFQVLNRYRRRVPSFDDDVQGTGAVVAAGIRAGLLLAKRSLADERVVFYGAGASGAGCALAVRSAMRAAGVPDAELPRRVVCLDSQGLILRDRPGLDGHKLEIAADPAIVSGWTGGQGGRWTLADVVRGFSPTVLVGVSGQPGSFTEDVVRTMLANCARPIVLCLSNPTNKTEARPDELLRWTNGAAIVGTGSPFEPVDLNGRSYAIGQGNNALIFPGFGLGALAVEAHWLPDAAFDAAAEALFEYAAPSIREGAPIFPPLGQLREVSRVVARAVGVALVEAEAAPALTARQIDERIEACVWTPTYLRYRAEDPGL